MVLKIDYLENQAIAGSPFPNNRLFFEAVLWIARTGSSRRDLPKPFGHWHRIGQRKRYERYRRYVENEADDDLSGFY